MCAASSLSFALISTTRSARNGLCHSGRQGSHLTSIRQSCGPGVFLMAPCSTLVGRWIPGGPGQYRGQISSAVAGLVSPTVVSHPMISTSPAFHVSYTTVPLKRSLQHSYVSPSSYTGSPHSQNLPPTQRNMPYKNASHRGVRVPYTAYRSHKNLKLTSHRNLHSKAFLQSHRNIHCRSSLLTSLQSHRYLQKTSLQLLLPRRTLNQNWSALHRHLHTSRRKLEKDSKPSSQVEVTVQDLKEKAKAAGSPIQDKELVVNERKTLWIRVKEEVLHYYHGFRLLLIDTKIACKYIWRLANGETLSRREHRQLVRTTSDLFRLLPFSVFIIIPFMELLLPVALKLFPGMLPSTFETANEKEAKMKKKLKVKLEMAKFLQQTLDNMAVEAKGRHSDSAKAFVQFYDKITKTGGEVSNEEIMKFSKLFEDEITLDSMSRPQLTALCRLLEMQPFGTNNFLRFQLRMKLRSLAADDKIIEGEGVDSLAVWELQQACRARGMRAYGLSEERMRLQLDHWLELSLKDKVPPSLLLLSRTLYLPENVKPKDTLAATISSLPEEIATRTKARIGKREGKIDNLTRLEVIRAEEKKIKEDQEELKKVEEERIAKEEKAKKKAAEEEAQRQEKEVMKRAVEESQAELLGTKREVDSSQVLPSANQIISEGISVTKATVSPSGEIQKAEREELIDTAPTLQDKAEVLSEEMPKAPADPVQELAVLTSADLRDVEEALENIGVEKRKLIIEEKELSLLKSEMADYQQDIEDFKKALSQSGINQKELQESKAARRLFSRVNKMVTRMEPVLSRLSQEKDERQKLVDTGKAQAKDEAELVSLEELSRHLNLICHAPDTSKVTMIADVLAKMDFDHDGAVEVDHVMDVLNLLLHEPGGVTPKLFDEVVQMMAKEEKLESAQLIQQALKTTYPEWNIKPVEKTKKMKVVPDTSEDMEERSEGDSTTREIVSGQGEKQAKHSQ